MKELSQVCSQGFDYLWASDKVFSITCLERGRSVLDQYFHISPVIKVSV